MRFRKIVGVIAVTALLISQIAAVVDGAAAVPDPRVAIETTAGTIRVQLFASKAPRTVANFLRYVDEKAYDRGSFMRTVRADNQPHDKIKIAVIQATENEYYQKHEFGTIPLERTSVTGIHHLDGTISMARDVPDSATASFFICIGDQPSLDFGGLRNPDGQGFGAFGRVTEGMDVVRRIQSGHAVDQALQPPVEILRIYRL